MVSIGRFTAIAAAALVAQISLASADPTTSTSTDQTPTSAACPKGMIAGDDGDCVKVKSGRMGFDLAAPDDESATSTSPANGDNTRGIHKSTHHHH